MEVAVRLQIIVSVREVFQVRFSGQRGLHYVLIRRKKVALPLFEGRMRSYVQMVATLL